MSSEFIADLIQHKRWVAENMRRCSEDLLHCHCTMPPLRDCTLLDVLNLARNRWNDKRGQLGRVIDNTAAYMDEPAQQERIARSSWTRCLVMDLFERACIHDNSKFEPEEFEPYDKAFPEFKKCAFGTPEYKAALERVKPAIQHHYKYNDHHPEHGDGTLAWMNMIQLIEMTCDWYAASKRSQTGIEKGLIVNKERYHIDDQLFEILRNTVRWLAAQEEPSR